MRIDEQLWGAVAFGYRPAPPPHILGGAELEKGRVSNAMSKKIVIVDDEKVGEWSWFNLTLHIDFDNVKQRDIFLELAREHGASLSFLEAPVVDDTQ